MKVKGSSCELSLSPATSGRATLVTGIGISLPMSGVPGPGPGQARTAAGVLPPSSRSSLHFIDNFLLYLMAADL